MVAVPAKSDEIPIAVSGEPKATLQIGADASVQERFAAEEIQTFIQRFTGTTLDIRTNRQRTETATAIVLGTPESNPTIAGLQANIELSLGKELGAEGYRIKTVEVGTEIVIIVAAHTERGVIYGAYAFIEKCITALTGLTPVHPELAVPRAEKAASAVHKRDIGSVLPGARCFGDRKSGLACAPAYQYEWWRGGLDRHGYRRRVRHRFQICGYTGI